MKKTVLLFVFDGFADWEISYATALLLKSSSYQIKTIALEKVPVVTLSGMCVLPDLDFRPNIDLADIDSTNTAMLILPGGYDWEQHISIGILPLIEHCMNNHIPVIATNSSDYLKAKLPCYRDVSFYQQAPLGSAVTMDSDIAPAEFSKTSSEISNQNENENTIAAFQYF